MRKILTSLFLVTVLLLAACGDSKGEKETVVGAYDALSEAKSYESSTTIDLELDIDINDPFIQPYIDMVNDIELKADNVYDSEKGLQETIIYFSGTLSPITFTLEVPFLQDLNNDILYIETDSLYDNFGLMLGLPEDLKGYLIEIDLGELDEFNEPSTEELQALTNEAITAVLNEKSDDDFSKDGNVYTISFNENDIKNYFEKLVELVDDSITADELDLILVGLDELFNYVEFNKFEVQTTIEKDEIKGQKFVIDVLIEEDDEYIGIALTLDTTYENMNGNVEFSINPDDYEILDMNDLEQLIFEMMYYGF